MANPTFGNALSRQFAEAGYDVTDAQLDKLSGTIIAGTEQLDAIGEDWFSTLLKRWGQTRTAECSGTETAIESLDAIFKGTKDQPGMYGCGHKKIMGSVLRGCYAKYPVLDKDTYTKDEVKERREARNAAGAGFRNYRKTIKACIDKGVTLDSVQPGRGAYSTVVRLSKGHGGAAAERTNLDRVRQRADALMVSVKKRVSEDGLTEAEAWTEVRDMLSSIIAE